MLRGKSARAEAMTRSDASSTAITPSRDRREIRALAAHAIMADCSLWFLVVIAKLLAVAFVVVSEPTLLGSQLVLALLLFSFGADAALVAAARSSSMRRHIAKRLTFLPSALTILSCFGFATGLVYMADLAAADALPLALASVAAVALVTTAILASDRLLQFQCNLVVAGGCAIAVGSVGLFVACLAFLPLLYLAARITDSKESEKRAEAARQRSLDQRARMMIRDFENSGRGWFWETDRQGRIAYISNSVSETIGKPASDLIDHKLTDIVAAAGGEGETSERTLNFHITARTAFNDLSLRVAICEDDRWWSMTGAPFYNDLGQYMGFRGHGTDLTEDRRSHEAVTQLARYDNLTGLANRRHIKELFEKALVDHRGKPKSCALFLLDLDRFKQVNDTLGHPAGDALLKQVSERLTRTIGDRGEVGRLGGDEFQVVLPGITSEEKLSEIARQTISNLTHAYMVEGNQIVIGASIGIAVSEGTRKTDAETLMRNADLALYSAKENGRGIYRFYHGDLHKTAKDRSKLEEELRKALETGGLSVAYQPVVNVASEMVSGFEALVRWQHAELGAISPARFIPIAEEAGLIGRLGEWVMRQACAEAARWPEKYRIAVNVSPNQFVDPAFPALVVNALAQSGLEPERLELEVTESVYLVGSVDIDELFKRLKAIGVRIVLDDFGTGYSALAYIKRAPFDKIKIDQSFVRGASDDSSTNAAIIRSIVTLAEALGMETTAEGAETMDELELVRSLGCSHVQGYIYGKPMFADAVAARQAEHGSRAIAQGFKASRKKRYKVLRKVAVEHDGYCYEGKLKNISVGGAMVEGLWDVPEGTEFVIGLSDRMRIRAVARWSQEDRMGLQFAEAIDIAKFRSSSPPKFETGPAEEAQRTIRRTA